MNDKINYSIQDANALDETVTRNLTALTEKGFRAEQQTTLQQRLADLVAKEREQNRLTNVLTDLTSKQDGAMISTVSLIEKLKTAVTSAYLEGDINYKLFINGKRMPRSLKSLRSYCEELSPLVEERSAKLLESGLMQDDITALNAAPAQLLAIDKTQEDMKKQRKQATIVRDDSEKLLKETVNRIRKFVKAAFKGNKEMLVQFEPIPKGRGGGGGGEEPPAPDNPE